MVDAHEWLKSISEGKRGGTCDRVDGEKDIPVVPCGLYGSAESSTVESPDRIKGDRICGSGVAGDRMGVALGKPVMELTGRPLDSTDVRMGKNAGEILDRRVHLRRNPEKLIQTRNRKSTVWAGWG